MSPRRLFRAVPYVLLTSVMLCAEGASRCVLILSAAIIHECGHTLALLLSKNGVARVVPRAMGLYIVPKRPMSYPEELIVCLAGPLANIVTAACLIPLLRDRGVFFFAAVNFLLAAVNLLPMFTLDGGRALRAALSIVCKVPPDSIYRAVSLTVWSFLWFSALYFCGTGYASPVVCILLLSVLVSTDSFFEDKRA